MVSIAQGGAHSGASVGAQNRSAAVPPHTALRSGLRVPQASPAAPAPMTMTREVGGSDSGDMCVSARERTR